MNAPFIASTVPPCLESKKKVLINPITEKQFFIQFKARLPASDKSTINEAHIIMEHVTETDVSLDLIVLRIEGILMDETTISCNNIPHSYEVALQNDETWTLNCESIINHTTIIDYRTSYTCHFTVDCENFDPSKNSPKWINVNTTLTEKKQRLFCQDVNQTSNKISCQCDFPTHIYDDNDWVISDISFGEKYVSRSVKNEIIEMTKQSLWTDQSSVTFMFTIKGFDTNSNIIDIDESKLNSYWIFYLVTDAFPCKETNWTQWSICDAVPVGIGQSYRSHIAVHGLPGQELQCNQIKQHKQCVVNQEKRIKFSKTEINVKEGDDGETVEVRLYHQLSNIKNKSLMTLNEKQRLKGFDVIIYFEIPRFYQKEIVIDPNFIGWQSDKWDVIEQVKITALDDSNIDSLMQKIIIKVNIYSIDTDYNELVLNPLTVIVEDNDKCKYCGIGNIQPFNPVPPPLFWDFKSILLLIVFLIVLLFILWRGCKWFKSKYGVNNDQYKKLKEDGLITESETETETESASHTDKALNSEINSDDKTDIR